MKTPNLGLNLIDRTSPTTTYFDLEKYLDENWRAIDTKVGVAGGLAVLDADGKVPADQLNVKDPADASTTQKGIVQLTNATNSTSETLAPTAKALTTHAADSVKHTTAAERALWNSGVVVRGAVPADFNSATTNGIYLVNATDWSAFINYPKNVDQGSAYTYGVLEVMTAGSGALSQTYRSHGQMEVWVRSAYNSGSGFASWQPWQRLLGLSDFNNLKQLSVDGKGVVAGAINGKGGNVSASNTHAELATAITNLPVKRWAQGTFNGQSVTAPNFSSGAAMTLGVNNMSFSPTRVFIRVRLKDTSNVLYIEGFATASIPQTGDISMYGRFNNRLTLSILTQQSGGFTCLVGSSRINDYAGSTSTAVIEAFEWFAYE
ncbi:hypothetical protein AOU00_03515 [Paenibacillus polymyxa]|nr:pyocin knob domain-containing protein [Paenibacillus polymyxa]AOK88953.1 hypothetical protein AOU00_03515 [Paenibacillus polymyxa]